MEPGSDVGKGSEVQGLWAAQSHRSSAGCTVFAHLALKRIWENLTCSLHILSVTTLKKKKV